MKMKKRIIIWLMFVLVAVASVMVSNTAKADEDLSAESIKKQIEDLKEYQDFFQSRYNDLSQDTTQELKAIKRKINEIHDFLGGGEVIPSEKDPEKLERYQYSITLQGYKYNYYVLVFRSEKFHMDWDDKGLEGILTKIENLEADIEANEEFGNRVADLGYEIGWYNVFAPYKEFLSVQQAESLTLSETSQNDMDALKTDLEENKLYDKIQKVKEGHDATEISELQGRFSDYEDRLNAISADLCSALTSKYKGSATDSWNYGEEGLSAEIIDSEQSGEQGTILSIEASSYPRSTIKSISLLKMSVPAKSNKTEDPGESSTENLTTEKGQPTEKATGDKSTGDKRTGDEGNGEPSTEVKTNWFKEHIALVIIVFSSSIILVILLIVLLSLRSKNKRKEIAEKRKRLIKERDDEKTRLLQQPQPSAPSGNIKVNQAPMQGSANNVNDPNRGVLFADDSEEQTLLLDQIQSRGINVYLTLNEANEVALLLQGRAVVGRGNECDVQVKDPGFSRKHFMLEWDGESVYVSDLGTTNGTVMNGVRLRHKRRLEPGDVLKVGSTEIRIRW